MLWPLLDFLHTRVAFPRTRCMLGGKRPSHFVGTHTGPMAASGLCHRSRQSKRSFTACWVRWTKPARRHSPWQLSTLQHWRVHRSRKGHTCKAASRPFQRTPSLSACLTAWSWPSSWSSSGMTCCYCRWDCRCMLRQLLAQLRLGLMLLLLLAVSWHHLVQAPGCQVLPPAAPDAAVLSVDLVGRMHVLELAGNADSLRCCNTSCLPARC